MGIKINFVCFWLTCFVLHSVKRHWLWPLHCLFFKYEFKEQSLSSHIQLNITLSKIKCNGKLRSLCLKLLNLLPKWKTLVVHVQQIWKMCSLRIIPNHVNKDIIHHHPLPRLSQICAYPKVLTLPPIHTQIHKCAQVCFDSIQHFVEHEKDWKFVGEISSVGRVFQGFMAK